MSPALSSLPFPSIPVPILLLFALDIYTSTATSTTDRGFEHLPQVAPSAPPQLPSGASLATYTEVTTLGGSVTFINGVGSECGFVTSDIRKHLRPLLLPLSMLKYLPLRPASVLQ